MTKLFNGTIRHTNWVGRVASYYKIEVGEREHETKGRTPLQILRQVECDLKSSTASEKHRKLQVELAEWLASSGKVKSIRAEYAPPVGGENVGEHKYDLHVEWSDGTTEAIEVMRRAAFGNIPYGRRKNESILDYALRIKGLKEEDNNYSGSKLFAYSAAGEADMNSVCVPIETYEHVRSHIEKSGLRISKIYTFDEGKQDDDDNKNRFRAVLVQP